MRLALVARSDVDLPRMNLRCGVGEALSMLIQRRTEQQRWTGT